MLVAGECGAIVVRECRSFTLHVCCAGSHGLELVRHGRGTPCSKPPCFGGVFKHDVEAAIACDSASHQHIVWWGNGEESGGSCVVRGAVAGHVQQ